MKAPKIPYPASSGAGAEIRPGSPVGGPPDPPRSVLGGSGGVLLILLVSLAAMVLLVFFLSNTPFRTLWYLFFGPLQNLYRFGNMLNGAVSLILGGLGILVAMKAGSLNLGGEGQIYAGAFTATVTAIALAPLGVPGAFIALSAGALAAGIAAGLPGLFKALWNTSEPVTSFLLSNVLVLAVNYLVTGPFLDPETNLQSTRKIPVAFRLPRILEPSNLSAALFIALFAVILVRFFLERTRLGYELRIAGNNELFARYGGINTKRNTVLAMGISGMFYGLAGGLAVFGTYYGTVKEFSAGMGWNGLAVALIAGLKPWAVIPSAIFFVWTESGARIAMQFSDITFEISSIVRSVVFFLVTSAVLRNLFFRGKARR
ncbi:MAG: ABC transporter permease [Treponema sp.]|nr:ABC transporter permease [Treponema sp.]